MLNNLLGTFYVDQEKGWTILNRGVVIGSNHFNIEELIRGLSNRDCDKLINKMSEKMILPSDLCNINGINKATLNLIMSGGL